MEREKISENGEIRKKGKIIFTTTQPSYKQTPSYLINHPKSFFSFHQNHKSMKLSKKLLQAMTMSLAVGATVVGTSCSSLRENAEVTPEAEKCTVQCLVKCEHDKGLFTGDNCPACGLG